MDKKLLVTAAIGKTHGFEGFLRIHPMSGETGHLEKLKECVVEKRDGKQVAVSVLETRKHADCFLMKFASYDTKEKAAVLSGGRMLIERSQAPKLKKGEYYIADLYSLSVLCDGDIIGTVEAVCDGAQEDYLMIRKNDGRTILIPNMQPFVSKPDFENNSITILMKELLES